MKKWNKIVLEGINDKRTKIEILANGKKQIIPIPFGYATDSGEYGHRDLEKIRNYLTSTDKYGTVYQVRLIQEAKNQYLILVSCTDFGDQDSFKRSVERRIINAMQKFQFRPMPSKLSIVDSKFVYNNGTNNYTLIFKAIGEKPVAWNNVENMKVEII